MSFLSLFHICHSFLSPFDKFHHPDKAREDHEDGGCPGHADEGSAPVCLDPDVIAMFVDYAAHFVDDASSHRRSDQKGQERQLCTCQIGQWRWIKSA